MEPDTFSVDECEELLLSLLDGEQELLAALAPHGLDQSPLHALVGSFENERHAWFDLLGTVLWEVFSSNHEVRGADGRLYDLGSWRGSGGFIADVLNSHYAADLDRPLRYIDFYCGFVFYGREPGATCDEPLRPLFRYIFRGLRERGCTWTYSSLDSSLLLSEPEAPATEDLCGAATWEVQGREGSVQTLEGQTEGPGASTSKRAADCQPLPVQVYREVYGH